MTGVSCWHLTTVSVPTNCNENSEKRILQKSHSDSTINEMTSYFHGLNNLEWKSMDHQFPDNRNSFYTRVPGMIKMGLVKLEQGGHFQLHWHKGTKFISNCAWAYQLVCVRFFGSHTVVGAYQLNYIPTV